MLPLSSIYVDDLATIFLLVLPVTWDASMVGCLVYDGVVSFRSRGSVLHKPAGGLPKGPRYSTGPATRETVG